MEFRRIKKEILTEEVVEGEVGKEETNSDVMNSYEAQEEVRDGAVEYREAILRAAQSESSAIEEYETILKLEEQTNEEIKNLFHDMIIHIRDEEKAHFQMLAEGLSKFPGFDVEEELEKAKQDEEITESTTLTEDVMSTRTYNVWDIDKAVQKYVTLSDEAYDQISDFFYRSDDEISAEEAQSMIDQIAKILRLSDDVIVLIENELNATVSPAEERVYEFRDDINDDIAQLQQLLENEDIKTYAAYSKIASVIAYLKDLTDKYKGNKNTGWTIEHYKNTDGSIKGMIS